MTTYTPVRPLPARSLLATVLLIVLAACGASWEQIADNGLEAAGAAS